MVLDPLGELLDLSRREAITLIGIIVAAVSALLSIAFLGGYYFEAVAAWLAGSI